MADELIPFGSSAYFVFLGLLFFCRGMDFLSTWIATPNLQLEANPLARRLGWRGGILLNLLLCGGLAAWPLPAIIVCTTSLLVAARNFQSAWVMRSMGEARYRCWIAERMSETSLSLFLFCLAGQTALLALVGAALIWLSEWRVAQFGIGMGIITYAVAILIFTLLSLWRIRRSPD